MDSSNRTSFKDSARIAFDVVCDCLPGISTANNLVDIWEQNAYKKATPEKNNTAWRQKILKKKKWVMVALLFPVIGQLVVGIHKLAKACFPSKTENKSSKATTNIFTSDKTTSQNLSEQLNEMSKVQKLEAAISEGKATAEDKYDLALIYAKSPSTYAVAENLMQDAALILTKAKFQMAEWNNPSLATKSPIKNKAFDEGFSFYKLAADDGMLEAQFYTGFCYLTGKGVDQNEEEGAKYLALASDRGHGNAQYYLGNYYLYKGENKTAFELYKSAVVNGCYEANSFLADCYAHGRGTEQDLFMAKIHLDKVLKPDANALELLDKVNGEIKEEIERLKIEVKKEPPEPKDIYQLALLLFTDKSQHAEAARLMEIASPFVPMAAYQFAEWNNPDSEESSPITAKDASIAFHWYKTAADDSVAAGDPIPDAEFKTGYSYLMGIGVEKDIDSAVVYLTRASDEADHPQASYYLATHYASLSTDRKDKNAVLAFELYSKAQTNNFTEANFPLGKCYTTGFGTDIDEQMATVHLELALQSAKDEEKIEIQKLIDQVASLHDSSEDVSSDELTDADSFNALKAKADKDDVEACIQLAVCYQLGLGHSKDLAMAELYLGHAFDNTADEKKQKEIVDMIAGVKAARSIDLSELSDEA